METDQQHHNAERLSESGPPPPQTQQPPHKPEKHKTDGNASFLRAARAGNLEKVLEYLKGSTDINTSNANGLNALHLASKEGHVNIVTELLKRGANVDAATKKGNTALHIASLAGQEEIVKILVQNETKVNAQSQSGFTPLYMAAQENHAEVVKFLLANGAGQSLATEDGFTPLAVALQQGHDKVVAVLLENDTRGKVRLPALHIAAKKDDVKAASLLLQNEHNVESTSKSGGLVNDTTKSGFTPLHIASHYGNINVGSLLIEKGADVNFKARNSITPLHVASKWGRTNMVTLLLDNGGIKDCKTRDGLTPLHCGARSGHEQVVDLLLERHAPVASKTKNGLSPLHMAAQGDHVDCARLLLYHKAPIDEVTVDYLTPLHVAAHCGNVRTAKLLLDRKCEVNARALNGFTPLHIACKKNRIKVVELLLKYGASIEATTESGLTPLHVSSFMGHMNIVIFLIQHGANPDTPTVRGETALHLAARANQTDIIRILLRNGAQVDAKAREQQTPLHIAARLGNVDNVVLLLQHGASPDATTKDLYTPLHIAAKEGHEEVASVLLEHGASQNLTTKKGFTPLHIAAKYGNIKVARLLLQKEADPNVQGKNGLTPLHVATHYNHVNVALLLLENGASPHCTAKNGYTPLHIAAKKNQMDIATTLLEYNAKPNAESKNGFTPLHLAAQEGHTDMVSLLLEHDADVNCKAKNGLTPMHLAAQEDKVPVAEILVKYEAQIDPQTKAGYTPLHTACHFGQINMIRYLLEHNASVNATTKLGYTPLHQAAQQGHVLVINLLLKYKASPNAVTNTGQTPLSIAQRLGYISVVEILKHITEVVVTQTSNADEKYKVVSPETMQETLMTDSEDEGGEDTLLGDPTMSIDDMKFLGDDSITPVRDEFQMVERFSTTTGSVSGIGTEDFRHYQDHADFSLDDHVFDSSFQYQEEKLQAHVAPSQLMAGKPSTSMEESRAMYGSYSGASFSSSFDPDNIALDRHPIYSGKLQWKSFLVSFMVDARGGAMRGCRHSGVRIIVPPGKACMPTRVTCKLVKKEKLTHPPPLMEGEALASRILEMGPVGAKFLGPVILEVPHFASLRGKEREIVILRSDNGETWREHNVEATEEALHEALNGSFEGEDLESAEELYNKRITRILTQDFPHYFAVVTRIRQETKTIGPESGMLSSTVVPQVQAVFPEGALTKKIKVGLQAQPIPPEVVSKMLGNRVAVSPIVTVEPRRRKFHKPITLTIPLPKASQKGMINQYGGDTPTLRLLCSITGGTTPAQWEDITSTTPLTFVNDCASFTTAVSARFWLMDCQNINEAAKMSTELYREVISVPFMAKFVVFSKRYDSYEARLRVFCMTDDKMDKTLESQEQFNEIARSRDVEVLEGKAQYIEMAGNLVPVTKSGDQLYINFHAFRENRLPFNVRIRDSNQEPVGRIAFMKEQKVGRGEAPQTPICNLNIHLPDSLKGEGHADLDSESQQELRRRYEEAKSGVVEDQISKAELRLTDIADTLQGDWVMLARQLNITEEEITKIQTEYTYVSEQALVMLHLWVQKNGDKASDLGNDLERALRKIGREDVIRKCMYNIEEVTDAVERAVAKVQIDQAGFDAFKEELGPSRDSSMQRGMSLDVSYDEQDIMKDSESVEESGSEAGSVKRVAQEVEEDPIAEEKRTSKAYAVEQLIESVEGAEVHGMDDRVSLSSEDSMVIHEPPYKDGVSEKHIPSKTKTPPPSPTQRDNTEGQEVSERQLAAKLAETEQWIADESDRPVEATPMQSGPPKPTVKRPAGEDLIKPTTAAPVKAEVESTPFEEWVEQEELESPQEVPAPEEASPMDEISPLEEKVVESFIAPVAAAPEESAYYERQTEQEEEIISQKYEPEEIQPEPQSFEDWVDKAALESPQSPVEQAPVEEVIAGYEAPEVECTPPAEYPAAPKEPEVIRQVSKGEVDVSTSTEESEETKEDGTTIRHYVTINRYTQPVTETILCDGVETVTTTTELVGSEVEEDITEFPRGITVTYGEGIQTETSVEEYEESMSDGTWLKKKIQKTKVTMMAVSPDKQEISSVEAPPSSWGMEPEEEKEIVSPVHSPVDKVETPEEAQPDELKEQASPASSPVHEDEPPQVAQPDEVERDRSVDEYVRESEAVLVETVASSVIEHEIVQKQEAQPEEAMEEPEELSPIKQEDIPVQEAEPEEVKETASPEPEESYVEKQEDVPVSPVESPVQEAEPEEVKAVASPEPEDLDKQEDVPVSPVQSPVQEAEPDKGYLVQPSEPEVAEPFEEVQEVAAVEHVTERAALPTETLEEVPVSTIDTSEHEIELTKAPESEEFEAAPVSPKYPEQEEEPAVIQEVSHVQHVQEVETVPAETFPEAAPLSPIESPVKEIESEAQEIAPAQPVEDIIDEQAVSSAVQDIEPEREPEEQQERPDEYIDTTPREDIDSTPEYPVIDATASDDKPVEIQEIQHEKTEEVEDDKDVAAVPLVESPLEEVKADEVSRGPPTERDDAELSPVESPIMRDLPSDDVQDVTPIEHVQEMKEVPKEEFPEAEHVSPIEPEEIEKSKETEPELRYEYEQESVPSDRIGEAELVSVPKVSMEEKKGADEVPLPDDIEEEYEEYEEQLPDGTVLHKQIYVTRTQTTIIRKVITHMPNGEISEEVISEDISGPTLSKHIPVEQAPGDFVKEPSPVQDEIVAEEISRVEAAPTAQSAPVLDRPLIDEDLISPDLVSDAERAPAPRPPSEEYDEVEETLADGTTVKRRIIKTKVKKMVTKKIRRVGPDGEVIEDVITEEVPESEISDTCSLQSSLSEARDVVSPVPSSPMELASPAESDSDRPSVRVYTDTIEGEPQIETDVQEFEETLPDGTIVKRKVIKTRQKQTVVKRVVMEGPESELPTTEEQAQMMLNQEEAFLEPDVQVYTDIQATEPESSTDVQEFEETLPDGTVVKRKVVTTTEQQLKTERTVMEGSGHVPGMVSPEDLAAIEADALASLEIGPGPVKIDMSAPFPDLTEDDEIIPDIQVREALPQAMVPDEPIDDELIEPDLVSEAQSAPPMAPKQEIQEEDIVPQLREDDQHAPVDLDRSPVKEEVLSQQAAPAHQQPPTIDIPDQHAMFEEMPTSPSTVTSEGTLEFEDAQESWDVPDEERLSTSSSEMARVEDVHKEHLTADEGELGEASGGDLQTTRLVMKKEVHKKTIIKDGKEETVVTEDTHVEQDNEGPEELRDSMQQMIDQFMEAGDVKPQQDPALEQS